MTRAGLAAALLAAPLTAAPAAAQVVLDGSLDGSGTSTPLPLDATTEPGFLGEYRISDDVGRYAGDNLFHSFEQFDVGAQEIAHFSASQGTPGWVIARVTGGTRSQINGLVRSTIPGASLALLNASGVSLGDGSQLDVQGSFYASTADALRFESGPDLLVADATPDPLLSAAPPEAFGFTSGSPALIEVARSDRLSVPAGETLSFVGGDVFVTGDAGAFTAPFLVQSPGSRLEIAAAAAVLDVPLALSQLDMDAVAPGDLGLVDVLGATLDLNGTGETPSGGVSIRSGRFVLEAKSRILARNDASAAPAVGPVDIGVTGDGMDGTPDLLLTGSQTQIQSWNAGGAAAGDVWLAGDEVAVQGGAQIQLFNGGSPGHAGDGPALAIDARTIAFDDGDLLMRHVSAGEGSSAKLTARESITVENGASLVTQVLSGASGPGGAIALDPASVAIRGDAQVSTLNAGSDAGGDVSVVADSLAISDGGSLFSDATASGSGGGLAVDVGTLSLHDGGRIASGTVNADEMGGTAGGPIRIEADAVHVDNTTGRDQGALVLANNGAAIAIDAALVELVDGGQILTRTFSDAPAGALTIASAQRVHLEGVDVRDRPAGLFTRTRESAGPGATGGLLSIDTQVLEVVSGAEISSATLGPADAGAIEIRAAERVTVRGGAGGFALVSASAAPGSTGDGARLEIHTDALELLDGGQVTTTTTGTGDAGAIDADARTLKIAGVDPATGVNPSGLFSRSNTAGVPGGGDGGDIDVRATRSVRLSDRGQLSASSSGEGLAGDVTVDAGRVFEMRGAAVTTEALASSGGNVKITADSLVSLDGSSIQTDVLGGAGGGGDVTIDPVHTVLNESDLTARAVLGAGGNISIVSDFTFLSGESLLDASSQLGIDGVVDVSSPETDLTSGLLTLPADYLDASARLARGCEARTARAGSFVVDVRGALPAPPDAPLTAGDLRHCPAAQEESTP